MRPTLWKITCEERRYPGLWQRWFRQQSVAIGWEPQAGFHLEGRTRPGHGWARARNSVLSIKRGDRIIVALQGHRVARIGTVLALHVDDDLWDPFVPPGPGVPYGDKGRRIEVRWDLDVGPEDREQVVELPPERRLTSGELRPTVSKVRSQSLTALTRAMADPANWVPLWAHFDLERALSGYIAAYPHRLEDGLLPFPNERLRERMFKDGTRLDVLLVDRTGAPVIVECKQGAPTSADIRQLRRYMTRLQRETGRQARGILVHGGARKLRAEVRRAAAARPRIQLVQHTLEVGFSPSL